MPNHIHLIGEVLEGFELADLQRDFLKFTSQQIKFDLQKSHSNVLEKFKVYLKDRKYQFWQDRSLSIKLYNDHIFMRKLHYPIARTLGSGHDTCRLSILKCGFLLYRKNWICLSYALYVNVLLRGENTTRGGAITLLVAPFNKTEPVLKFILL